MTEIVWHTVGSWALGNDELQWILYRRRSARQGGWKAVSFVRSTKKVLARCMREKGTDEDTARFLLAGLPDTFDQWKSTHILDFSDTSAPERVQEAAS